MQDQYAALNENTGTEDDDEVHHISFAPSHDRGCGVREPAPIAFLRDKDMFRIFLSYVAPRLEGETDSNSCMFHSMQEINLPTAEEERSCVFPTDENVPFRMVVKETEQKMNYLDDEAEEGEEREEEDDD